MKKIALIIMVGIIGVLSSYSVQAETRFGVVGYTGQAAVNPLSGGAGLYLSNDIVSAALTYVSYESDGFLDSILKYKINLKNKLEDDLFGTFGYTGTIDDDFSMSAISVGVEKSLNKNIQLLLELDIFTNFESDLGTDFSSFFYAGRAGVAYLF